MASTAHADFKDTVPTDFGVEADELAPTKPDGAASRGSLTLLLAAAGLALLGGGVWTGDVKLLVAGGACLVLAVGRMASRRRQV